MKKLFIYVLALFFISSFGACTEDDTEKLEDELAEESLYVQFKNSTESTVSISSIELRARGVVDGSDTPSEWTTNILTDGKLIAAGESVFITLSIPNTHWAEYRLGVTNGDGVQTMLYDQAEGNGMGELPITHWGSDDRSVSVTVKYNASTEVYYITSWTDFAGID